MHIKVFVSKSAAKKKNPVQTNVVATVKNGDKLETVIQRLRDKSK